jgi:oxygen-independent coproporphyrinogen-3 oxidase
VGFVSLESGASGPMQLDSRHNEFLVDRSDFLKRAVQESWQLPFVYCYPPRTSYIQAEAPRDLRLVWERDATFGADLNVYIHIPFCRYRCSFCGLYNITTKSSQTELHTRYVKSLKQQLTYLSPSLAGRRIKSLFIGGGTPFAVGIPLLVELLKSIRSTFPDFSSTIEEVTVEASPDSVVSERDGIKELVNAGVDRISIGVQSLDLNELQRSGRTAAGSKMILESLEVLRTSGIRNINADLMVGLEGQTDLSLKISISRLVEFLPETVSIYPIGIRNRTALARRIADYPISNKAICDRLALASMLLRSHGYQRETSIQFKRPNSGGLKHKQFYFGGMSVLGLGSGARSYTREVAYLTGGGSKRSLLELETYLQTEADRPVAKSGVIITPDEAKTREIVLGLHGLDIETVYANGAGPYHDHFASVIETAMLLGLLREANAKLWLTEKGFLHRELVCWALFSNQSLQRHSSQGVDFGLEQRQLSD